MVVPPASAACYIGEHNDFICNKLNMGNIVTPPKKFEKNVPNVNTDTKVPLPPPTYYPPDDGGTIPVAGHVDVSAPPKECEGEWKVVAADKLGWLTFKNGHPIGGKMGSEKRFTVDTLADGSKAVLHTIRKGDEVWPLGADSPILYNKPVCAVMMRYKMLIEKGKSRGWPGKYMALMGGRGQAGGTYENGPGAPNKKSNNPEGWSYYNNSPVVSGTKGTTSARNGFNGVIGSANRGELGASCVNHERAYFGGDPTRGNKLKCFEKLHAYYRSPNNVGEWVTLELAAVMNDKNKANGAAYFTVDGNVVGRMNGVVWALDPEKSPDLWIRWRMMYGGNPDTLPPPNDILREWYKDFEFLVIEK